MGCYSKRLGTSEMTNHIDVYRVAWGSDQNKKRSFDGSEYWNRLVIKEEVKGLVEDLFKNDFDRESFYLRIDKVEGKNVDNERMLKKK